MVMLLSVPTYETHGFVGRYVVASLIGREVRKLAIYRDSKFLLTLEPLAAIKNSNCILPRYISIYSAIFLQLPQLPPQDGAFLETQLSYESSGIPS
jgi:hypothetical protein